MNTVENATEQGRTHEVFAASAPAENGEQARVVVIVFALCSLFMMMSFGMTLPLFAHQFREASSGVVILSIMVMVPQITLFALAIFVGNLADRYGKYPFLVITFAGLALTDFANIFAHTPASYISIRIIQGIVCVGARPAMMGTLADLVPEQKRTRQISLIMAGFAGGLTLGPAIGGFLLQRWGIAVPFAVSACLNLVALGLVWTMVPRTSPRQLRSQQKTRWQKPWGSAYTAGLRLASGLSLSFLAGLLVLDFIMAFGRTFVEPQLVIYVTKVLNFPPIQLGLLMSGHGLAMAIGALVLHRLGERINKRLAVCGGFLLQTLYTLSLLFIHQFPLLFLASLFSGIGGGLILPLLGVCYLDNVKADHQAKMSGIKEAVTALGGIAGSLPVIIASHWLSPHMIFIIGGCIIAGGGLFAAQVLKTRHTSRSALEVPASALFSPILRSACSTSIE
jgi:MFS transporter, DHA1 family, multidrug resistance protein